MISSAKTLKRLLNLYPPYLGAGVKITYSSDDWKEMHVSMSLRWYNKNAVNTHFGGSLYSMVDPHIMLMLMPLLRLPGAGTTAPGRLHEGENGRWWSRR